MVMDVFVARLLFAFLASVFFSTGIVAGRQNVTIEIMSGTVLGYTENSTDDGNPVSKFKGIPYAEPPTGRLRFAKPEPRQPWEGVFDATRSSYPCPQRQGRPGDDGEESEGGDDRRQYDEDCLSLNIVVPVKAVETHGTIPIMVYLHGGGFTSGSAERSVEVLAITGSVIVITLNYRLGALGFLSTGDDCARGNWGLWDQRMAIQWAKANAASFGGDSDRITIFGQSAGAISVSNQVLSPLNDKGVFHRVISQSGFSKPVITEELSVANRRAQQLGMLLGCGDHHGDGMMGSDRNDEMMGGGRNPGDGMMGRPGDGMMGNHSRPGDGGMMGNHSRPGDGKMDGNSRPGDHGDGRASGKTRKGDTMMGDSNPGDGMMGNHSRPSDSMMGNHSRPGDGKMGNHSRPGDGMMGNHSRPGDGGMMGNQSRDMMGDNQRDRMIGGTMLTSQQLLQCLRKKSVEDILMATERVDRNFTVEIASFLPVIDGEFLPEPIDTLLQSPHIAEYDFIYGFNNGDGSVALSFPYARGLDPEVGFSRDDFSSLIDDFTDVHCHKSRECAAGMKQAITFAYTEIDKLDDGVNNFHKWVEIVRDFTFSSGTANAVRQLTQLGANVYAYEFTFAGGNFPNDNNMSGGNFSGGDDMMPGGGMTGGSGDGSGGMPAGGGDMSGGGRSSGGGGMMPGGNFSDGEMPGGSGGMPGGSGGMTGGGGGMPSGGGRGSGMSGRRMDIIAGANHGDELRYVFGGALQSGHPVLRRFSYTMMSLWTNFAWNGDPNIGKTDYINATWPKYDLDQHNFIDLQPNISVKQGFASDSYSFWIEYLPSIMDGGRRNHSGNRRCEFDEPLPSKNVSAPEPTVMEVTGADGKVLGKVRGVITTADMAVGGTRIQHFRGIPYAKSPTGSLRFAAPKKVGPWDQDHALDGTRKPPSCPHVTRNHRGNATTNHRANATMNHHENTTRNRQDNSTRNHRDNATDHDVMWDEDCLSLDITSPEQGTLLPVIFVIQGDNDLPSGGQDQPVSTDVLAAATNAIVVTHRYRVGVLGFLSTGDKTARGNYGLLDTIAALEWVRDYIGSFGGDPKRVMLLGHGSGGSIAHLLMFSPMSMGLFSRVMSVKGTAVDRIIDMMPKTQHERSEHTRMFAESVGCNNDTPDELIQCLRETDVKDIIGAASRMPDHPQFPVVDNHFLMHSPARLLQNGSAPNIDFLVGLSDQDHPMALIHMLNGPCPDEKQFKRHVMTIVGHHFMQSSRGGRHNPIIDIIANEYLEDLPPRSRTNHCPQLARLIELVNDFYFVLPTLETAKAHSDAGANVYVFNFQHTPKYSAPVSRLGAVSSDEVQYLFGRPYSTHHPGNRSLCYGPEDRSTTMIMMRMIRDFITSGDPGASLSAVTEWPKFEPRRRRYLNLNACPSIADEGLANKRLRFWTDTIPVVTSMSTDHGGRPDGKPDSPDGPPDGPDYGGEHGGKSDEGKPDGGRPDGKPDGGHGKPGGGQSSEESEETSPGVQKHRKFANVRAVIKGRKN